MKHYLRVDSLSKSYTNTREKKQVLDRISFSAEKGSFVVIFGPNGSGKTTLFNILAGLLEQDKGLAQIDGKPLKDAKISFLFQNFADSLFPWKNCLDNIAFPLELEGVDKQKRRAEARKLVDKLGISIPLNNYPYQCSGGQKQLTALARSLIRNPNLLLMDEPFSALDYDTREMMESKIVEIWSKLKVTTLLISHDVEEAILLADKILVVSKPPTRVIEEIEVNLPRPRSGRMFGTQKFDNIRKKVIKSFLEGVGK